LPKQALSDALTLYDERGADAPGNDDGDHADDNADGDHCIGASGRTAAGRRAWAGLAVEVDPLRADIVELGQTKLVLEHTACRHLSTVTRTTNDIR